jgi:hypothetical protein
MKLELRCWRIPRPTRHHQRASRSFQSYTFQSTPAALKSKEIDRARGATRLDDWADVRWLLEKNRKVEDPSADGRDVMLEEQMLRWDDRTTPHIGRC